MKRLKNTNAELTLPDAIEFYNFRLDNLFRVENHETGVLIRAQRANCSAPEKAFLIRELAAEGFIPDSCQWLSDSPWAGTLAVKWIVDSSWVRFQHRLARLVERFTRPILAVAALLLLIAVPILGFKAILNSALRPDRAPNHPVWRAVSSAKFR